LWGLPRHKELWFRGESRDYGETILRPELYRPVSDGVPLQRVWKLLNIENDLFEEFQRSAVEVDPISVSKIGSTSTRGRHFTGRHRHHRFNHQAIDE
jgi:hypothetical protein